MVLERARRQASGKMLDRAVLRRKTYVDDDMAGSVLVPVDFAGGPCRVELMTTNPTLRLHLVTLAGWLAGSVGYAIHFETFVVVKPGDEVLVYRADGRGDQPDRYLGGIPLPGRTFDYDLTVAAKKITPDV